MTLRAISPVPAALLVAGALVTFAAPTGAQPPAPSTAVADPSPEVPGCADFSVGAPRRLRTLRATGWALLPVGTTLALTAYVPDGPLRVSKAMLGLGVSLVGAGLAIAPSAGARLRRHCRADVAFEARLRRRTRWSGTSMLAVGAAGSFASLIFLASNHPTDEYGDYSPAGYVILAPALAVLVTGAILTAWSRRLERMHVEVAVGAGSLHVRGSF